MKKIMFSMFIVGAMPSACFAPPPEVFFEMADVQSYNKCMQRLIGLHGPDKVAQIIDVDGVLTNRSVPEKKASVIPRGHMDLAVRRFYGSAPVSARVGSKAEDGSAESRSRSPARSRRTAGFWARPHRSRRAQCDRP